MSKHWNPRASNWTHPRRSYRRRTYAPQRRPGGGGVRLMVLGGMFLGLAYVVIPGGDIMGPGTMVSPAFVSVIDGDTFRMAGQKVRIADIDTPEVRGRCASEIALAARATGRLEELLEEGPFEMHPIAGRDEDRYGRKLRIVTRDGRSLGDQLVAEGLARTWTGRREPWC